MDDEKVVLAVLIGTTRVQRESHKAASYIAEFAARQPNVEAILVDPNDFNFPGDGNDPEGKDARYTAITQKADAFFIVTPEYNHSFPASLKHAIDHFRGEWSAKPVALVSYGGMAGGLRAAEHLRLVFAELHAPTIREMVSFHNAWSSFEVQGNSDEMGRAASAVTTQLRQLEWWARHLRKARIADPYAF